MAATTAATAAITAARRIGPQPAIRPRSARRTRTSTRRDSNLAAERLVAQCGIAHPGWNDHANAGGYGNHPPTATTVTIPTGITETGTITAITTGITGPRLVGGRLVGRRIPRRRPISADLTAPGPGATSPTAILTAPARSSSMVRRSTTRSPSCWPLRRRRMPQRRTTTWSGSGRSARRPRPPIRRRSCSTPHATLSRQGDYATALTQCDKAIAKTPNDTVPHEFRGLVLFALHRYTEAAASLYAVLSVGPGWDWTTMSSLYPGRATSIPSNSAPWRSTSRANPNSADARFVLAYQYLTCGHADAAATQFKAIVQLNPKDQLSAQILSALDPTNTAKQPATTAAAAGKAGRWPRRWSAIGRRRARMERPSRSTFPSDGKYTWTFAQKDKPQTFSGDYTVADNLLVLKQVGHAGDGRPSNADGRRPIQLQAARQQPDRSGLDVRQVSEGLSPLKCGDSSPLSSGGNVARQFGPFHEKSAMNRRTPRPLRKHVEELRSAQKKSPRKCCVPGGLRTRYFSGSDWTLRDRRGYSRRSVERS